MKKGLLIIAVFWVALAPAQDYVDLLNFNYGVSPETGYDRAEGGTRVQQADLNVLLPLALNEKTYFITGLLGTLSHLSPAPQSGNISLYSLGVLAGVNMEHRNNWSSQHLLIPRYAASGDHGRSSFQLGTLQLLQKKLADNKNVTFGFYMNTEEFGILFVPILGYYYKHPEDRWEFSALMPSRAEINMPLGRDFRAGLSFEGIGSSFPIDNEQFGRAYVQRMSSDLSLFLRYEVTPSILLAVRGGYSLFRSYRIYDAADKVNISILNIFFRDPRTLRYDSVRDGFLFGVQLKYRFNLNARQESSP